MRRATRCMWRTKVDELRAARRGLSRIPRGGERPLAREEDQDGRHDRQVREQRIEVGRSSVPSRWPLQQDVAHRRRRAMFIKRERLGVESAARPSRELAQHDQAGTRGRPRGLLDDRRDPASPSFSGAACRVHRRWRAPSALTAPNMSRSTSMIEGRACCRSGSRASPLLRRPSRRAVHPAASYPRSENSSAAAAKMAACEASLERWRNSVSSINQLVEL